MVLAVATAAVLCAACGPSTVALSGPPEQRILVPADWAVLADQGRPPDVTATYTGSTLRVQAASGPDRLSFSSRAGAITTDSGLPVRCGSGRGREVGPPQQHVAGTALRASATRSVDTTKGPVVAEAFVPSAADTFDSAAQDTAAGLIRSALVIDGAQAKALTADPASVVVVEQWHHRFASGIALEGKLDGSLQAGFRLSLGSSGMSDVGGKDSRSSMTIDLVDCNAVLPSVLYGQDVNFFVLLVASGCSVRVNGAAPEDGFASASLGGDLDLVRVRSGGQPVHVAISGSRGEPLSSFDLTYTPGSD